MTPADFQSEYRVNSGLAQSARPVLHVVKQDKPASPADAVEAAGLSGAARAQSGFLSQSIDEIARLYVEAPFSW